MADSNVMSLGSIQDQFVDAMCDSMSFFILSNPILGWSASGGGLMKIIVGICFLYSLVNIASKWNSPEFFSYAFKTGIILYVIFACFGIKVGYRSLLDSVIGADAAKFLKERDAKYKTVDYKQIDPYGVISTNFGSGIRSTLDKDIINVMTYFFNGLANTISSKLDKQIPYVAPAKGVGDTQNSVLQGDVKSVTFMSLQLFVVQARIARFKCSLAGDGSNASAYGACISEYLPIKDPLSKNSCAGGKPCKGQFEEKKTEQGKTDGESGGPLDLVKKGLSKLDPFSYLANAYAEVSYLVRAIFFDFVFLVVFTAILWFLDFVIVIYIFIIKLGWQLAAILTMLFLKFMIPFMLIDQYRTQVIKSFRSVITVSMFGFVAQLFNLIVVILLLSFKSSMFSVVGSLMQNSTGTSAASGFEFAVKFETVLYAIYFGMIAIQIFQILLLGKLKSFTISLSELSIDAVVKTGVEVMSTSLGVALTAVSALASGGAGLVSKVFGGNAAISAATGIGKGIGNLGAKYGGRFVGNGLRKTAKWISSKNGGSALGKALYSDDYSAAAARMGYRAMDSLVGSNSQKYLTEKGLPFLGNKNDKTGGDKEDNKKSNNGEGSASDVGSNNSSSSSSNNGKKKTKFEKMQKHFTEKNKKNKKQNKSSENTPSSEDLSHERSSKYSGESNQDQYENDSDEDGSSNNESSKSNKNDKNKDSYNLDKESKEKKGWLQNAFDKKDSNHHMNGYKSLVSGLLTDTFKKGFGNGDLKNTGDDNLLERGRTFGLNASNITKNKMNEKAKELSKNKEYLRYLDFKMDNKDRTQIAANAASSVQNSINSYNEQKTLEQSGAQDILNRINSGYEGYDKKEIEKQRRKDLEALARIEQTTQFKEGEVSSKGLIEKIDDSFVGKPIHKEYSAIKFKKEAESRKLIDNYLNESSGSDRPLKDLNEAIKNGDVDLSILQERQSEIKQKTKQKFSDGYSDMIKDVNSGKMSKEDLNDFMKNDVNREMIIGDNKKLNQLEQLTGETYKELKTVEEQKELNEIQNKLDKIYFHEMPAEPNGMKATKITFYDGKSLVAYHDENSGNRYFKMHQRDGHTVPVQSIIENNLSIKNITEVKKKIEEIRKTGRVDEKEIAALLEKYEYLKIQLKDKGIDIP